MPEATYLDEASGAVARHLANRVSRRSALGRLGLGAVAVSLGSAGAAIFAQRAEAYACPGCAICTNSVRCQCLSGGSNSCPSDTCQCGWWCVNDSGCTSGHKFWIDCCGGCRDANGNVLCSCKYDCIDGATRPYCCYTKEWGCGCGTQGSIWSLIKCRIHVCGSCTPGTNC
jgi:hypothetical protein